MELHPVALWPGSGPWADPCWRGWATSDLGFRNRLAAAAKVITDDFDRANPASQWQRFCDQLWYDAGLEIWLDVSRMALNSSHLNQLKPQFERAFAAMAALEGGAIANPDEQRMVGHYWLRHPELAPDGATADHIRSEVDRIDHFGRDLLSTGHFSDVLWIGIGGSGLGPLLMVRALGEAGAGLPFHFIDNVDPDGISQTLARLGDRLRRTLVVVVSKSGGTPEPRIGMEQARARLESLGGRWVEQAVAVTMVGSRLDQLALEEGWLARFDMFDWVGGRTSITSAVGLLSGALVGADIHAFLEGAAAMDRATRVADLGRNPAALMAAAWHVAGEGKGKRDMVVLPYCDRLEVFSRYLQQLVMESLGKHLDRQGQVVNQGIAVYGNKGSTDQHAYVQQLRDGIDNFFVTFIEVLSAPSDLAIGQGERPGDMLDGFLQGTRSALLEGGRQSLTLTLAAFDARRLGALVALFERAVGLYAELVNVNAYDQPGVEAGKKAAAAILELQGQVEALLGDGQVRSLQQLAAELNLASPEPLFWILRHLCANDVRYGADGDWSDPAGLQFRRQPS